MKHVMIAMVETTPENAAGFRDWYTQNNIEAILELDGFTAFQRFELSDLEDNTAPYRFFALYEIDDDKLEAADASYNAQSAAREAALAAGHDFIMQKAPFTERSMRAFYTQITDRLVPEEAGS
jgi:hypothetical protein